MMGRGRLLEAAFVLVWLHCLSQCGVYSGRTSANLNLEDDMFRQSRQPPERNKVRKHHQHASSTLKDRKPNIILLLTDDQDVELGSLNYMPRTLRLLREGGAELRHAYTTTPMCCPSRSSLLTGLYMHNHHVYTNNDNCSNSQWQATHETRSFATYLSNAGYRTGYFGKYLNKYNGSYIPPGWREWGGLIMNSRYYNYSINLNGKKVKHGDDYAKDYYPDLIVNDSISFLRQSKQYFSRKPVMLVLSFPAPHGPEDSAPQYSDMFFNVTTHHTPSYDYAPNSDKQWILQVTGKMQPIHRQFTDMLMTKRLQTLQSVDVAVEKVYQELKALGELDNTYIVYTSDHGYHLGQFGLVKGKSFPFEFDVRVPFLIRGPGIEPGSTIENVVLNIDLAPTFLDMAGVEAPSHMDGRSFYRLLMRQKRPRDLHWPDTFLIESSGRRETAEMIAEAKLQESLRSIEKNLNQSLEQTTVSVGEDAQLDNQVPSVMVSLSGAGTKLARLALECQRPEYQPPCRPGQKWQCVADGHRWRKHKCKVRPVLPRPKARKCACFTASGVMYTKLDTDDHHSPLPKHLSRSSKRNDLEMKALSLRAVRMARRANHNREQNDVPAGGDFDDTDTFKREMEEWLLSEEAEAGAWPRGKQWARRARRDVKQQLNAGVLEQIMNIKEKILNLEDPKNGSVPDVDVEREWNCTSGSGTAVSCSDAIYNSPETWRATQQRLELEIRKLRTQLEKLKEIKKFLKEKKPYDRSAEETDDDDDDRIEDGEEETDDDLFDDIIDDDDMTTTTTEKAFGKHRRKFKNRFHDFGSNSTITSEGGLNRSVGEVDGEYSSEGGARKRKNKIVSKNTDVNSLSKHRHRHKQEQEVKTSTAASVVNVTNNRDRDWPGPGLGRIDVTILEPVLSQTRSRQPDPALPPDTCYCDPYLSHHRDEKEVAREARRRLKEERMRRKERKMRRKAKLESECLLEKMNCFNHDNQHWRTPPFWTEGPFCFCMNANNNTYSCLRTINKTHNFLYCEFVTGFITFYNLRLDPFEQWNRASLLTAEEKSYLHDSLAQLKRCRGARQCMVTPPPRRQSPRRPRPPEQTTSSLRVDKGLIETSLS